MRLDFVTLFPEMFESVLGSSILKRAAEPVTNPADPSDVREPVVSYHLHNPRDYADNKHNKVDDAPYGGGAGMVLQCQPIYDCVLAAEREQPTVSATRIVVTPTGVALNQRRVEELASKPRLLVLCGHYEGFDQRVLDELEPMEVSLGDYVLTGGELPAMVLADTIVRLLPGVIGKAGSHVNDSFSPGTERLLDHPHYTRPPVWSGRAVPEVLQSGDHQKIAAWRREQSETLTRERRPDLLAASLHDAGPALRRNTAVSTIVIRDAHHEDHDAVDALLRAAFETDAEAKLVQKLREQGDAPIELVAEAPSSAGRDQVIGHILFSPISVEGGDGRLRALGLAPLAVEPAWQGRGVGRTLVRQGVRMCEEARAGAVFVLGEPGYYGPQGFETASKHGFGNEYGVDEPFMILPLRGDLGPAGIARFAPAFDAL
ncbi:MAG: tRNA (guanosine(37)-N1)-methyltransferase TrmD [Planctomycetota bacterium]